MHSVVVVVDDARDPRIDDQTRALKAGLMGTGEHGSLCGHSVTGGEGDGVSLRMNGSPARVVRGVLTVWEARRSPVVTSADDSPAGADDCAHLCSLAGRTASGREGHIQEHPLAGDSYHFHSSPLNRCKLLMKTVMVPVVTSCLAVLIRSTMWSMRRAVK